ncbi:PLP-dependent transferase [Comamonas jiangduensis]|uniref:PLP-dependent transferase n=1 Tax=Comamonas jiangduensis TaxID=1194168 RepID=UPI0024E0FC7F|nr:PLP-dependent transferase [Comamonas jiangduensis]
MKEQARHITTDLVHHSYQAPPAFAAIQPAVHKASTVIFDSMHDMRTRRWLDKSGFTYGLHGTPTTYQLEERLCSLEGGKQCLLVPSGLSAISTVALGLLSAGDEVLIPDNAYGPNKDFAEHELARWGIRHAWYNSMDVADLQAKITPATKLVWLEAPGSVSMEFPDLVALVQASRARGVTTVLDNTWGAGLAFKPFDLLADGGSVAVDVSAHALTKYPSGGGDVLMGSIITTDNAVHMRIKLTHMRLGIGIGANDAELVLRSLSSIAVRYHAHDVSARVLAAALQRQPAVVQLLHPAFAGAPGHAHWQQLCGAAHQGQGAAAGLFSVVVDAQFDQAAIDRLCDSLQLFKLGYSWGGPMSLVVPYDIDSMRAGGRGALQAGTVVRFCVGLEDTQDLLRDLAQAWEKAFGQAWVQ